MYTRIITKKIAYLYELVNTNGQNVFKWFVELKETPLPLFTLQCKPVGLYNKCTVTKITLVWHWALSPSGEFYPNRISPNPFIWYVFTEPSTKRLRVSIHSHDCTTAINCHCLSKLEAIVYQFCNQEITSVRLVMGNGFILYTIQDLSSCSFEIFILA